MKITKQRLKELITEEVKSIQGQDLPNKAAYADILNYIVPIIRQALGPNANLYKVLTGMAEMYAREEWSPDSLNEDGHIDVPSARRKLKTSIEDAMQILQALEAMPDEDELPSWWMSKLTLSADYLNKTRDYLLVQEGKENENNPWAICTASVGREDEDKYESCVKSVKKQNKKK